MDQHGEDYALGPTATLTYSCLVLDLTMPSAGLAVLLVPEWCRALDVLMPGLGYCVPTAAPMVPALALFLPHHGPDRAGLGVTGARFKQST